MAKKLVTVLLAEDNKHDILATKRAWKQNNINNPLHIVRDGEACLDYLYRRGAYSEPSNSPTPDILLLDLNMPKMGGLSVIKHLRADEKFRHLPIIVLTTSKLEQDRLQSYDLGVNAYIQKPIEFENFSQAMMAINMFWQLVELPEQQNHS
ncbi:MAG: response regulator [Chloroflexota bacterium]